MLPVKRRNYDFLDSFFDNVWMDDETTNAYYPKVDILDDENNIYLEADLPGMEKKDININVEGNTITLSGTRDSEKKEKKKGFYRCERQYGKFERKFYLGENADATKAGAEFDKGVLKITVPKKEEAKPKSIDIAVK